MRGCGQGGGGRQRGDAGDEKTSDERSWAGSSGESG